MIRRNSIPPG